MAITASDVIFRYSVVAAAGDTTTSSAALSLGDQISTAAIADATLNALFENVTGDENAASTVDYRAFFILNNHGSLTWETVKVWISAEVAGGASVSIGLDPAGVTVKGLGSAQAATIANDLAAPAGVSFTAPTTKAGGLSVGNVAAGSCFCLWVRRTAANTIAVDADGATFSAGGDTAA